jgi:uncharacterized RDD family membrane protein YckC
MQTNVASTCTECGGVFPADDLIRHENARVCVKCKPAFLQKLAEGAEFKTSMRYAGFWLRFGAVLLDGIILFVVNLGLGMLIGLSATQAIGTEQGSIALLLIVYTIQLAVGISYETIMIGKFGATVGKMACKIHVVTANGDKVSYARAFGRYFAKLLSAFTLLIGYIMAAFDSENRALHDRVCDTRVVLE